MQEVKISPKVMYHPTDDGGAWPSLPSRELPRSFFDRSAEEVARDLIGKKIVSDIGGEEVSAYIVETHAYTGANDAESHTYRGKSSQTADWKPGSLYVYSAQGNAILTIATPPYNQGATVLIRALQPIDGIEAMQNRRGGVSGTKLTQGPGSVARALGITTDLNGSNVFENNGITLSEGLDLSSNQIAAVPRVKANKNPDPLYRFFVRDNKWVGSPKS